MIDRRAVLVAAAGLALASGWLVGSRREPGGLQRVLASAAAQPASIDESRRNAIVRAAERVGPAVVSVNVVATQVVRTRPFFDDPFFGGLFGQREHLREVEGLGSGFIVSQDGYIITNQHVVAGATRIFVTLLDGRQFPAELIAADETTDLAVLKIEAEDLPVAPIGDSDDLLIGEWAIAIGNPFGYLLADRNPSVTVGVISALGRDIRPGQGDGVEQVWSNMIQTDAAINPGNSGGPLVNSEGEVIGVNSFIFSRSGGSIGLGFAIPINRARRALADVVEYGSIRRPWTGLHVSTETPPGNGRPSIGVIVTRVDPGSPAAEAGLKAGDLLVEAEGEPIGSALDWEGRVLDMPSGASVDLVIQRDGGHVIVNLTPEEDPLARAPRIQIPFAAEVVILNPTLSSSIGLESATGFYLDNVQPGGALRNLGLRTGDILLALNGRGLDSEDDVDWMVGVLRSGGPVELYVERDGVTTRLLIR
ncbi:MAG TPA: trypsin-like peptidase domain-containing protein [Gemmatimonadota bacterium]|nr:trypsin-like peptidase domain-containing protein [Gemmatimonadota bacterium]